MPRPFPSFLLAGMCLLARVGANAQEAEFPIKSPHFLLYVEKLDTNETVRLLEAAYDQLRGFFKVEPDRKLKLKVFGTVRAYQAEMDRLRKVFSFQPAALRAQGFYARDTACSYLYVQPTEYRTRHLLLHEAAYQYHDFVRPWGKVPSANFCGEGLAEHFALHTWDGQSLRLGIIPGIDPEGYVERALEELQAPVVRRNFTDIVTGARKPPFRVAWAIVSYLLGEHPEKFNIWRQAIDNEIDAQAAWQKQFGQISSDFHAHLVSWVQSNAPLWRIIQGEWTPWGEGLKGRGAVQPLSNKAHALAVLKNTPKTLHVEIQPVGSNSIGGVVLGYAAGRYQAVMWNPAIGWVASHEDDSEEAAKVLSPNTNQNPIVRIEPQPDGTLLSFGGVTNYLRHPPGTCAIRLGRWDWLAGVKRCFGSNRGVLEDLEHARARFYHIYNGVWVEPSPPAV